MVQLDIDAPATPRLTFAWDLARRFEAHLIAFSAAEPHLLIPGDVDGSAAADAVERQVADIEERLTTLKSEIDNLAQDSNRVPRLAKRSMRFPCSLPAFLASRPSLPSTRRGKPLMTKISATRGLIVSALTGAVISSTAVTLALSRTAKEGGNAYPLAGAASLAAMVSVGRVCLIVGFVEPQVLVTMGPAALAGALGFGLCGILLLLRQHGPTGVEPPAHSSFELGLLLLFALLFAVVATINAAPAGHMGSQGLVATSAISGVIDVDVAALSAAFDRDLRHGGHRRSRRPRRHCRQRAVETDPCHRLCTAPLWMPFLLATAAASVLGGLSFFLLPAL